MSDTDTDRNDDDDDDTDCNLPQKCLGRVFCSLEDCAGTCDSTECVFNYELKTALTQLRAQSSEITKIATLFYDIKNKCDLSDEYNYVRFFIGSSDGSIENYLNGYSYYRDELASNRFVNNSVLFQRYNDYNSNTYYYGLPQNSALLIHRYLDYDNNTCYIFFPIDLDSLTLYQHYSTWFNRYT